MRNGLAIALSLLLAGALSAEEESGVTCDLAALRYERDARLLKIYDGLRLGLEKARLGRVCEETVADTPAALDAFAAKLEAEQAKARDGKRAQPVAFAFGDTAASALAGRAVEVPRVFVVTRYTAGATPLAALPEPTGPSSVVFADMRMERVGEIVTQLLGKSWPQARLAWSAAPKRAEALLARARDVSGLKLTTADAEAVPEVVLHLRLGVGETMLSFRDAALLARKHGVPLITDDVLRFRGGVAAVVLAAQHRLVGRYAAEAARVLTRHPGERLRTRGVAAMQVWLDLDAVDRQRLRVPLPFVARANLIHRRPLAVPRGGGG